MKLRAQIEDVTRMPSDQSGPRPSRGDWSSFLHAPSVRIQTCKNAGFSAGTTNTLARRPKTAKAPKAGLVSFRFKHRGASDYAGLLKTYRAEFHVTQAQLVRLTGFSPRSGAKWCQGETPSPKQEKALVEMDRLFDDPARVIEPAHVGRWLTHPNPAFDGSTPLQVVERGELDRIWRMLYGLEVGQPG